MDHGERSHSKWGMSNAHRWFVCPGSVALEAVAPPETPSPAALAGTAAHEFLEKLIAARLDPIATALLESEQSLETIAAVGKCLEHVELLLDANPDAMLFSEVGFKLPSQHIGDQAYGTCDIGVVLPSKRELHVIDYKNGVEVVDHENNLQLRGYGTGIWFAVPDIAGMIDKVAITIVQPNAFHASGPIRTWWTDPWNLIDFMEEYDAAVLRTLDPKAPLVPTLKGCQYCKAITICPAAKAKGLDAALRGATDIKLVNEKALPDPQHMRLDELAYTLAAKPFLELWLQRVEEAAYSLAMQGHMIPGRKLVNKLTRRKYDGEPEKVAETLQLLFPVAIDEIMPRKLLGLTEMEALLTKRARETAGRGKKKEAAEQALESFAFVTVKEPATGLTLVPLDDRRAAVNPVERATEGITLPVIAATK